MIIKFYEPWIKQPPKRKTKLGFVAFNPQTNTFAYGKKAVEVLGERKERKKAAPKGKSQTEKPKGETKKPKKEPVNKGPVKKKPAKKAVWTGPKEHLAVDVTDEVKTGPSGKKYRMTPDGVGVPAEEVEERKPEPAQKPKRPTASEKARQDQQNKYDIWKAYQSLSGLRQYEDGVVDVPRLHYQMSAETGKEMPVADFHKTLKSLFDSKDVRMIVLNEPRSRSKEELDLSLKLKDDYGDPVYYSFIQWDDKKPKPTKPELAEQPAMKSDSPPLKSETPALDKAVEEEVNKVMPWIENLVAGKGGPDLADSTLKQVMRKSVKVIAEINRRAGGSGKGTKAEMLEELKGIFSSKKTEGPKPEPGPKQQAERPPSGAQGDIVKLADKIRQDGSFDDARSQIESLASGYTLKQLKEIAATLGVGGVHTKPSEYLTDILESVSKVNSIPFDRGRVATMLGKVKEAYEKTQEVTRGKGGDATVNNAWMIPEAVKELRKANVGDLYQLAKQFGLENVKRNKPDIIKRIEDKLHSTSQRKLANFV